MESGEPLSKKQPVSDASGVCDASLTQSLQEKYLCAGVEPLSRAPCQVPATAEINGLLLCERHAREFEVQSRVDILDLAAHHLYRWLESAGIRCNDELLRRLQTALGEVKADLEGAHAILERAHGEVAAISKSFESAASPGRNRARTEDEGAVLSAILDNLDGGVLATDLAGDVVFANSRAREVLGIGDVERIEGIPDPWKDIDLPATVSRCIGLQTRIEAMAHAEGDSFRVKLEYLPEYDDYKGGALVVVRDLFEMTRLEANQQRFLANAVHELKTPITTILGSAEILLDEEENMEVRRRFLEHIHSQAKRMQRLSERLLEPVRTGVDLREPNLCPVTASFTKELAERMEPFVEGAGLSLILDDRGGCLLADPERLEQALLVLVSNAVKYSEKGGRVWLRAEGGTVTVEDEGEGIRKGDLPHIFESYYQGRRTRSGSGLGLPICKDLVERMGGEISIDSKAGIGTVARIRLPEVIPNV